jgi:hypothetical protein
LEDHCGGGVVTKCINHDCISAAHRIALGCRGCALIAVQRIFPCRDHTAESSHRIQILITRRLGFTSSSMKGSIANTLAKAPSPRSDEVRIDLVLSGSSVAKGRLPHLARFSEVPEIEVRFIHAPDEPTLVLGDASLGPTAAAIGNAVARDAFRATTVRVPRPNPASACRSFRQQSHLKKQKGCDR